MKRALLAGLARTSQGCDVLCKALAAAFLAIIAIAATAQVVGRYLLGYSPPWIEELTRYSSIWMTMLGAAVLVRANGHAVIDILVARFEGRTRRAHAVFVNGAILAAAAILVVQGIDIIAIVHNQLSPAMRISMGYVYAALPAGGLFIAVQSLAALARDRSAAPDAEI